jgi:hypothetical protein
MKPQKKTSQPTFDVQCVTTPRAMALAVVLASAATMLLNATVNPEHGSPPPANIASPTRDTTPHSPEQIAPRAVPVHHITQAHARL